jgi:hypothetical protein
MPSDPLAALPAATFSPAVAQPAYVQQPAHVFESATPLQSGSAAAPSAGFSVDASASDLWFLASEAEPDPTDEAVADRTMHPPTLMTAGLTVAMAVVVIILVLIFIQLMTSLLH